MAFRNQVFVGCGTDRCETMSLPRLINQNFICTHEPNPILSWKFNRKLFKQEVKENI